MASLLRPIRSSCRLYSLQRYLNTRCSIVGKNKYVVFKGTKNDEFSKREFSTGNELSVSANIARNVSDDSLDRALHRADMDVRRTGRLNRSHVDYIFSEIQKLGTTSPTKSLLLIRCCGSLIAEEVPEKRNQLVNDIWKTLIKQNSPIDVSHYNALIKVYLENNHKFSCTEFLQEMKENGIEPNRVTYQRMIEKYCQEGDIEGASNILQLMKDSDMAVNESVFNALIVGHSRANDMENAKKVLEVMNNANLEPSSTTYTSLLCAYAEQGDIQSIRETLTEIEKNEINLADGNYFSIIQSLASKGLVDNIEEILSKCPKQVGYNQDCINNIMNLMNYGYDDSAYKLLLSMSKPSKTNPNYGALSINVFLKHLITLDRPVEQIVMYCKRLSDDDFFTFGLSKAAEQAYNSNKTSLGLQIVLKMVEEGTKPRSHFFWPGLAVARNNKDTEEIFRILNIMNQVGCPPNYETFVFYILPAFDLQNPEAVVRKLRETVGQNTANIMNPVLSILLSDNRLMEAVDLVRVFPCPVYAAIIPKLAGLTKKTSDYHLLFQILQDVKDSPNQRFLTHEKPDWNGVFLIESIRINNRIEDLEELLNQMASKNILITQNTVDQIRNILNNELQPNINELLERLVTTDEGQLPNQAEGFLPHPNDMNLDELEAHFIELKSKNMNTRGILRKLLLLHCRLKNYERAVELKKITEDEGHEMTSSVYSSLIELFCHYKKLDKAVECKNWIDLNDSNFMIDDYKIINLARMYTQNGRIDDAIALLRSTHQKLNVSNRKLAGVQSNVRLLLSDISSTGDIENTQRLYDTIVVECGYASPNSSTLASIINACIVKGNLELAVAKLEEFAKEHKVTPIVNNILVQLILQEDTDGIRRVMDASSAIHGEVNILYNLAFAFIDAGKVNQAKKIFETRGLRANMDRLEYKCDVYLRRNQVTYLENLVKVTRDLFGLNRDVMYFYLIRAYCKIGDVNKALGVWLTMQEENVIASSKTLRYLADFLKSKNHPVPFQIPEQGISPGSTQQSQSGELSTFRESLASNNLDKALDDKRMLEANGQTLNLFSFNKLIKELLDAHRINDAIMITKEMFSQQQFPLQRTIRRLLSVLGQNGDLGTLEELKSYVTPVFLNNVDFDSAIGTALVINHRHLEYLSTLEEDLENLPSSSSSSEALAKFPYRCLFVMMERHPQDTTERVTALAETYAKNHNYYDPMNMVWVHHFISKDFNAAEKILKDYPKLMHNLKYMWIITRIQKNKDEEMAQKLLNIIEGTSLSQHEKMIPYSALMGVLAANGKLDEALKMYNDAIERGCTTTNFSIRDLVQLKNGLSDAGKVIPFAIPTRQMYQARRQSMSSAENNSVDDVDSDSSSSSDSE